MGTHAMKLITQMQNVWDTPLQGAIMAHLAWWESDTAEYASVSYGYLARHFGVERRYVMREMEKLELEKHAVVNLGPDPDEGGRGRNRWKLTLEQAIAKVRQEAGVGEDVPLHRIERRRVRRKPSSTVVIPGSPEKERNDGADAVENDLRSFSGGAGITPLVIPGSPPGDPRITPLVIPGSPQSGPVILGSTSVIRECTADAPASASPNLEFQLIGEVRRGRHDRSASEAIDARRARLYDRIKRHARWLLEHPHEAAALNAGAAIATESDLVHVTKVRCARLRIAGYAEGDVLDNVCRSEWHLFAVRRAIAGSDMERGPRRKGGHS